MSNNANKVNSEIIVNSFTIEPNGEQNNLIDLCFDNNSERSVIKVFGEQCNGSQRIFITEIDSVGKDCDFHRIEDEQYNNKFFGSCESDPLYWKKINEKLFIPGDLSLDISQTSSSTVNTINVSGNTQHTSNILTDVTVGTPGGNATTSVTTRVVEPMGNILADDNTVVAESTVTDPDAETINKEKEIEETWLFIFILIFIFGIFLGYYLTTKAQ